MVLYFPLQKKPDEEGIVDERRKLYYFGHKEDGNDTIYQKWTAPSRLQYTWPEPPLHIKRKTPEDVSKRHVFRNLKVDYPEYLDRFLIAPERKNVWAGGIRTQCEGILSAKNYFSSDEDRGVYTVIPEIEQKDVTVDAVYKMWLALECAMIRRESLIIVEDPALANVTKFRTEQWRFLSSLLQWGCGGSILMALAFRKYPCLYVFPFCLAMYGFGKLREMRRKDPASRYTECAVNKQYEIDPDSHFVCDAQISLRYLRCPGFRIFKPENFEAIDETNHKLVLAATFVATLQLVRNIYSADFVPALIRRGFEEAMLDSMTAKPLNAFEQLTKRFLTFGNTPGPGRSDLVHWIIQNGLAYYFFLRHIPWAIQTLLEYVEREYVMETTIRYLQFRNLCGEERYEFPARNLYWTMQKDYPNNRILKEIYDHFNDPPQGYYESEEFLATRKPAKITLSEVLRRWKISYYRNW